MADNPSTPAASNGPLKVRREPTLAGKVLVLLLIVVSLLLIATMARAFIPQDNNLVKKEQYQAVFLTNGQTYFGKLSGVNRSYLKLEDTYYLQGHEQNAEEQPNLRLIKRGEELHGPEDEMFIERDKVVYWENLKDGSRITQEIKNSQN